MTEKNEFLGIAAEIAALLKSKNTDYDGSFYKSRDKYGPVALLMKLTEKMDRLDALISKPGRKPKVKESVEDTIIDIAGYAILELQYRREHAPTQKIPAKNTPKSKPKQEQKPKDAATDGVTRSEDATRPEANDV